MTGSGLSVRQRGPRRCGASGGGVPASHKAGGAAVLPAFCFPSARLKRGWGRFCSRLLPVADLA